MKFVKTFFFMAVGVTLGVLLWQTGIKNMLTRDVSADMSPVPLADEVELPTDMNRLEGRTVDFSQHGLEEILSFPALTTELTNDDSYKVLIASDLGCYGCLLRLENWRGGQFEHDYEGVHIIRIYTASSIEFASNILENIPDYGDVRVYDTMGRFFDRNSIHTRPAMYLLNSNNKVVASGFPMSNDVIADSYHSHIKRAIQ